MRLNDFNFIQIMMGGLDLNVIHYDGFFKSATNFLGNSYREDDDSVSV